MYLKVNAFLDDVTITILHSACTDDIPDQNYFLKCRFLRTMTETGESFI